MTPSTSFPDECAGMALLAQAPHDSSASALFYAAYANPLGCWLERHFSGTSHDLIVDAVQEALCVVLSKPERFEAEKGTLRGFLQTVARRKLLSLLGREQRHQKGRKSWDAVEPSLLDENLQQTDPLARLIREEEHAGLMATVREKQAELPEELQRCLDLMLAGERSTRVFAVVLGMETSPIEQQERAVKRVKDKLSKRLQRGANHDD